MRCHMQAITRRKCGAASVTAAELRQIKAATQPHVLARAAVSTTSAGWRFPRMACPTAGPHYPDTMQVMKPDSLTHAGGHPNAIIARLLCQRDVRLARCPVMLINSVLPMQSAAAGAAGSAGPILIRVYIHVIQVSHCSGSKQFWSHSYSVLESVKMLYPKFHHGHPRPCTCLDLPLARALQTECLRSGCSSVSKPAFSTP